MSGVVFFENSGGYEHAHLVIKQPSGARRLHFEVHARFYFQAHPEPLRRRVHPRPVVPRGTMRVWRIGPTDGDLTRVEA